MNRLLTILLLSLSCICTDAADFLFKNGKSDYKIVLPTNASASETTAAHELQTYILKIGNIKLPIINNTEDATRFIYLGYNKNICGKKPEAADESFTYLTDNGNLYIWGGEDRGTMYGVFSFLEQVLGIRWYTSSYTHIPKKDSFELPTLCHREQPAFLYREDFYYDAIRHNEWLAHNCLNSQYQAANTSYGKVYSYWGMHTFSRLLPPDKYFSKHPDYYSLNRGKRSNDAQLCLSNANMRVELTKNLLKEIEANPDCWCFDVSQNDNSRPCECEACIRLKNKWGGESGIMIWFVNQVAREVRKTHPEVFIGTFAYRYTRKAPESSIKPEDNVVIRLCDIECCMAHPLGECHTNKSFIEDFHAWRKKSRNIFIWDYTTGFTNYQLPFPNLEALAENYQFFAKNNIIGILEEGSHNAQWSEFSEMKQWVVAKLLWNPTLNTDSLIAMFINDYYGKAAPQMRAYYNLCRNQIKPDIHFTIKIDWNNELYSNDFISDASRLLNKAAKKAKQDSSLLKRIARVETQLLYLKACRNKGNERQKALQKLKKITDADPTIFNEAATPREKFFKEKEGAIHTKTLSGIVVTLLAVDANWRRRRLRRNYNSSNTLRFG